MTIAQVNAALPKGWFADENRTDYRLMVDFNRDGKTLINVVLRSGDTGAEVNYSAIGSISPAAAAEFAQALTVAAEFAATLT